LYTAAHHTAHPGTQHHAMGPSHAEVGRALQAMARPNYTRGYRDA
jgi:hypothetical protein